MTVFQKPGKDNTQQTLRIALDYAKEHHLPLVVASCTGETALQLTQLMAEDNYNGELVVVSEVFNADVPEGNRMPFDLRADLLYHGHKVVTAAHALSGAERGLSKRFGGVSPVELIAATLRLFSQGVKVCVEISLMAMDAGAVNPGSAVVAIGGTDEGADTACVLTPGFSASVLDTKVHEILCKPY